MRFFTTDENRIVDITAVVGRLAEYSVRSRPNMFLIGAHSSNVPEIAGTVAHKLFGASNQLTYAKL